MQLNSVLSGKYPVGLDSLPDLILVVPKAGDISRLTPLINREALLYEQEIKDMFTGYSSLDAEKDLLEKYPDYYTVIEKAEKEKNKILLELAAEDTPDERFLKTPEEVAQMDDKQLKEYMEYYKQQYNALEQKYIANPLIRKSFEYIKFKDSLYKSTDDFLRQSIKRMFWLIHMAENSKGEKYFSTLKEGIDKIDNLPLDEYNLLFEMWNSILDGFSLPF